MASQVILEDFRGSGNLAGAVSGTVTGISGGSLSWGQIDGTLSFDTGKYTRTAAGTTVVVPAVGQAHYARLTTGSALIHSSGVSVFEASVMPGFQFRVFFDFSDRFVHLEVDTAGNGRWMWDNGGSTTSGSFTGAAPGTWVVLRIEVTSTATRYYVDDVLKYTHSSGVPYGLDIDTLRLGIPRAFGPHGLTVGSTPLALNYAHFKTETVTGPLGGPVGGGDVIAPVFGPGAISVLALYTEYTANWPAASDDVSAAGSITYEYRVNGGAWTTTGTTRTLTRGGLSAASSELLEVRAKDEAGNFSDIISVVASTYPTPTAVGLLTDAFTLAGPINGSFGQTGVWANAQWQATTYKNGSGTTPGGDNPGAANKRSTSSIRSFNGLQWTAEWDYDLLLYNVSRFALPGNSGLVIAEPPVVLEVACYGDFSIGINGQAVFSATLFNSTTLGGQLRVTGGTMPPPWTVEPGNSYVRSVGPVVSDQLYTLRIERALDQLRVYLDGTLLGTGVPPKDIDGKWVFPRISSIDVRFAAATSAPWGAGSFGLTAPGETARKLLYVNLRAGTPSGPLGKPRDPNEDEEADTSEPLGPNNEPSVLYGLFWTEFNATYEVP